MQADTSDQENEILGVGRIRSIRELTEVKNIDNCKIEDIKQRSLSKERGPNLDVCIPYIILSSYRL